MLRELNGLFGDRETLTLSQLVDGKESGFEVVIKEFKLLKREVTWMEMGRSGSMNSTTSADAPSLVGDFVKTDEDGCECHSFSEDCKDVLLKVLLDREAGILTFIQHCRVDMVWKIS